MNASDLKTLEASVMERFRSHQSMVSLSVFQIGTSMAFGGFVISVEGTEGPVIHPDPSQMATLRDLAPPTNKI